MRETVFVLIFVFMMLPLAVGEVNEVEPVVLVGCFDAQVYPPIYLLNYTGELADLARESLQDRYSESIEVIEAGDWFFLLDALTMPNVIGAMLSLNVREAGNLYLSQRRIDEFISSFEKGLGLVGIHGLGYAPYCDRISREVFPLNGDKFASGRISRDEVITMRHSHEKYSDHVITLHSSDRFEAADVSLVYKDSSSEDGWWTPAEGEVTVLYISKLPAKSRVVPSIVAYEREAGRSVIFAGLRHTDGSGRYEMDMNWYNHSLSLPEVRDLLAESLIWAVEPFLEKARMEESSKFFEERFSEIQVEKKLAEDAEKRLRNSIALKVALISIVSVILAMLIGYLGFVKGRNNRTN